MQQIVIYNNPCDVIPKYENFGSPYHASTTIFTENKKQYDVHYISLAYQVRLNNFYFSCKSPITPSDFQSQKGAAN